MASSGCNSNISGGNVPTRKDVYVLLPMGLLNIAKKKN